MFYVSKGEAFIKDKFVPKLNILLIGLITLYSILQAGFNNFIGVYISFNVSSQAGAVFSYIFDFFKSFYWYYYLILLPFILLIVYYELINRQKIKIDVSKDSNKFKNLLVFVSLFLVFGFIYNVSITLDIFQNKFQTISNQELFKNSNNPSIAIREFGTTMYAFLDIKNLFINDEDEEITSNKPTYNQEENIKVDDTKWLELIENEDNLALNYLNNYFINNKITGENSYTGMFEDKNLIVIMMESVNDIFINEDYTLVKIATVKHLASL